jgi:dihydrofolate reductase
VEFDDRNPIYILKITLCSSLGGTRIYLWCLHASLIKEKLIDEFYLFINPVAIGNGMTIFKDLNEIQKYSN